jgi:hypothetical protein
MCWPSAADLVRAAPLSSVPATLNYSFLSTSARPVIILYTRIMSASLRLYSSVSSLISLICTKFFF